VYEYKIKLERIIDGDTIVAKIDLGFDIFLENQAVRLYGIDTPEVRTTDLVEKKYGKYAASFLEDLISNKSLTMRSIDYGKYGRIIGEIYADGVYVNQLMIDAHVAVPYNDSKEIREQAHLENRKILNL
jgi:micrococcal nuclease